MGAQMWVKAAFSRSSKISNGRGYSGSQAADHILRSNGVYGVAIETASGFLGDHYDPRTRTLRLSRDVYQSTSLAALGVAAHEAGHALQHADGYLPLQVRSLLVPITSVGSTMAWPVLLMGFLFHSAMLFKWGVIFFSSVVAFQMITLPVEFNASYRALRALKETEIVSNSELAGSRRVLTAAAMTYVAASATAVLQLVYFLIRGGMLGGSDE